MRYGASVPFLDKIFFAPLSTWYSHPWTSIFIKSTRSESGITSSSGIDFTWTAISSLDLNANFAPVAETALLSSRPTNWVTSKSQWAYLCITSIVKEAYQKKNQIRKAQCPHFIRKQRNEEFVKKFWRLHKRTMTCHWTERNQSKFQYTAGKTRALSHGKLSLDDVICPMEN